MNRYYYAGLPYSDELYHHGIIGQKWGVRRFQNADGTWTAAGKERYGSGKAKEVGEKVKSGAKKFISAVGGETKKAAKAVGNASKRATKFAVKRFKMKHPSFASDEELMELKRRVDLERSYKDAKRDLNSQKLGHRFLATVGDISKRAATEFATNTARNAANKAAEYLMERKSDRKIRESSDRDKMELAKNYETVANNMSRIKANEHKISKLDDKISELDRRDDFDEWDKLMTKKEKLEKENKNLRNKNESMEQKRNELKEAIKTYGISSKNKGDNK